MKKFNLKMVEIKRKDKKNRVQYYKDFKEAREMAWSFGCKLFLSSDGYFFFIL